jgi:two-component sensor histidine kinase
LEALEYNQAVDIQLRITLAGLLFVDVALAAAFIGVHRAHAGRIAGTRYWRDFAFLAFACHAVYIARGWIPAPASIVLTNLSLTMAAIALLFGCAALAGRTIGRRAILGLAWGLQTVFLYFTFARPDETVRSMLSSAVLSAAMGYSAYCLVRTGAKSERALRYPLGTALTLASAVYATRISFLAIEGLRRWDFVFLLLMIGLEVLFGFAYLRMIDKLMLQRLQRSADEKSLLLHELRHRTKNSLSLIGSLVSLQADQMTDPGARNAFEDLKRRLRTIQSVYRLLSNEDDRRGASIREYLGMVIAGLRDILPPQPSIRLEIDAPELSLDSAVLVPLGLIANELATNAVKHAFPPDSPGGSIRLSFAPDGGAYRLSVVDDGRGLEPGRPDGLGLTLVRSLARQLRGELELSGGPAGGLTAGVRFPADA